MTSSNGEHETAQRPAAGQASGLGPEEMARAVRAADPAALVVLPRILRRVIKRHRDLGGFAYKVPHRKSYVIDRPTLLDIADQWELGLGGHEALPDQVILIAQPGRRKAAAMTAAAALTRCWRLLFHARVHLVLERQAAAGKFTAPAIRRRMLQLGLTEFEELRNVLQQEGMLLPPHDDLNVYIEFAATYLELRQFAPSFLARYFPGLDDLAAVDRVLAQDIDAEELFRVTRLPGAPEPGDYASLSDDEFPTDRDAPACEPLPPERPSDVRYRRMLRRAQRPAAVGNVVGAAIYRARAARSAPPELAAKTQAAVRSDIAHLIDRLRSALDLHDQNFHAWQESLLALVAQTPRGIWTAEARLLYDLQKACVDHERDLYTVGVVEWALSLGRRPIKRPLPNQREVLLCKHLRTAMRRLPAVRIADAQRRQLAAQLHEAIQRIEEQVRQRLRPLVTGVFDEVGLLPHNAAQRVSHKKLVEEMLDCVVERGYVTFGDLRDAISRNHVKLPDVAGVGELWHGDALLRADRRLAVVLDGVYRRGEIYLRWMQQFSSLGFGTEVGRFLTKYLVVPFGGAYMAVAGVYHLTDDVSGVELPILTWQIVLSLGAFLFGVIHVRWFRQITAGALTAAWRGLRGMLIDPLVWLTRSFLVQRILRSRWFLLTWRFAIQPGAISGLIWWMLPRATIRHWPTETTAGVSLFLAVNLLLNSRVGLSLKEMTADWLVQSWHDYGLRLLAGAFYAVIDFFRAGLEWTERVLYSVDEWLRFKSGEGRPSFLVKAALSLIWFYVTYFVRFTVNVLVEPQINPIKHFPVVTVSHKLLLALYYPFAHVLAGLLNITLAEAFPIAMAVIWCIPGVFGFLAWELRENWRLYAANRADRLKRVIIGSHGEGMPRLLRPGFHSGTIPKRFAKLRRAERKAREKGFWKAARKQLEVLRHVERDVRRYVEREFAAWFAESRSWPGTIPAVEKVSLATNRVRVALRCPAVSDGTLWLTFEVQSGWLLSGVRGAECAGRLTPRQQQTVGNSLLGLYKTAAVELVCQQVEDTLHAPVASYHCDASGLVLWPDDSLQSEVRYDLRHKELLVGPTIIASSGPDAHSSSAGEPADEQATAGRQPVPAPLQAFPTVDRSRLIFRETVIAWQDWVAAWEREQADGDGPVDAVVPVRVLPAE